MCQGHTVPDSMPDSWDAVVTSVAYHVMTASSRVQMYLAIQLTASKHGCQKSVYASSEEGSCLALARGLLSHRARLLAVRQGRVVMLVGLITGTSASAMQWTESWCVVKSAPTRPHKKAMIRSVSDRVIVRTFFHHDLGSWDLMENQKLTLLVTFGRCYTRK